LPEVLKEVVEREIAEEVGDGGEDGEELKKWENWRRW
jgi:hypothetical protein